MTDEIEFIPPELLEGATPAQRQRYKALLEAKKAMRSPLDYMMYVSPRKAKRYRHTEFLNDVLTALVENRLYKSGPGPDSIVVDVTEEEPNGRRVHPVTGEPVLLKLMTSMPPRIGKSYFLGEHFPAWFLTKYIDQTVMYMSYGASLAERFSRLARDHVNEHPELGAKLDETSQSVKEWNIAGSGGGFIARGFGGVPTGRGGNLLIDDPFQDGQDAMSDNQRDYVYDQYVSSLLTRVEAGCWIILNATRWHEDDLHGRLLDKEADEWYVVNLPAIAFDETNDFGVSVDPDTLEPDVLGRKPGEAICPALYPASFYLARQKADPFWYDAEYMGKPSGIGGGLFSEFSHYKRHQTGDGSSIYELFTGGAQSEFVHEKDCVRFMVADTALTDKESADWTVIGIWDLDPWRRLILREVIRERITGDKLDDRLREEYVKWGCRVFGVEQASVSYKLIQDMVAEGGINIWPLPADKNKKVRALPAAVLLKRKKLLVDRDGTWRPTYESELKKFDKDKYDDQVDMTSYSTVMRDLLKSKPAPALATSLKGKRGFEAQLAALADAPDPKEPRTGMTING